MDAGLHFSADSDGVDYLLFCGPDLASSSQLKFELDLQAVSTSNRTTSLPGKKLLGIELVNEIITSIDQLLILLRSQNIVLFSSERRGSQVVYQIGERLFRESGC